MVTVRFLEDHLRECFLCEAVLFHVPDDEGLVEELISELDVLSAEALGSLFVLGHLLDLAAHGLSSDLFAEAATDEFDVSVLVHDASDEVLEGSDPWCLAFTFIS
jgi:hypothetical protein